jgi:hypothetical protein
MHSGIDEIPKMLSFTPNERFLGLSSIPMLYLPNTAL